ncbi:MAG: hypothetical protein KKA76_17860, partial [Proteobacteria bacterium]|nr:hypothetical protein [Pseudomonadota bacterium]
YEITRDKVKLTPIRQEFESYKHFVDAFSKTNPHARFLTDPIEITDLNYSELTRYKRLALATFNSSHWITGANIKKLFIAVVVVCLAAGMYSGGWQYFTRKIQQEIVLPSITPAEPVKIQYYYEIHLIGGGFIDGFELKQNKEKVFITNRKGLDVTVDVSSIQFIEKIEQGNALARNLIYGSKL